MRAVRCPARYPTVGRHRRLGHTSTAPHATSSTPRPASHTGPAPVTGNPVTGAGLLTTGVLETGEGVDALDEPAGLGDAHTGHGDVDGHTHPGPGRPGAGSCQRGQSSTPGRCSHTNVLPLFATPVAPGVEHG